jgi:hypothetical protein
MKKLTIGSLFQSYPITNLYCYQHLFAGINVTLWTIADVYCYGDIFLEMGRHQQRILSNIFIVACTVGLTVKDRTQVKIDAT